jgi:hypothetical protein
VRERPCRGVKDAQSAAIADRGFIVSRSPGGGVV